LFDKRRAAVVSKWKRKRSVKGETAFKRVWKKKTF